MSFIFLGAFLSHVFCDPQALLAQEQARFDSSLQKSAEASAYEIDRFRLLRWVRAHQDTSAKEFLLQTLDLVTEADGFARQKDYFTAQLIIGTALELTALRANPATAVTPSAGDPMSTPATSATSEWRREILFGTDLWRQEYELGLASADTMFSDGNPFVGVRLSWNRDPARNLPLPKSPLTGLRITPENRALTFEAYALLKSSRDYFSGEAELNARQPLGNGSYWRLQNRLEGTSYRRDFDLQYWQNITSALVVAEVSKNFRLEVADEFRWRRYREQNDFYPNYIQNRAGLGAVFNAGYTTRLDSRYYYIVQAHDLCPSHDYVEHRLESSIFQNSAANASITLDNIWRQRIYPHTAANDDCRNSYQKTYQEEYARAELKLGLSQALALRIDGDFVLRQYQTPSDSIPDFLGTTVNPQLQFNLSASFQIRAGYLYSLRVYDDNIIQGSQPATASAFSNPFYEDYYSHGFTLGVDLIRTDGLLFSLNENFEMRTYPNSTATHISDLGLYSYTDRNLNSLLLFFSWNFHPRWQANVLANFDNDHSRVNDQSDSRHTLFSLDLGYSF
ncbi:MAG: hypothetical protein ALAOOOJD_02042 [bacterium]|nr:hypothetical protein [bacterium]